VYAAVSGANTQTYGIQISGGTTNFVVDGPVVTPNTLGTILVGGTNTNLQIRNAVGYNPVGIVSAGSCTTGNPCPITAQASASTLYITGGTVTGVTRGGSTVCTASPCAVHLEPGQQAIPTFSGSPTFTLDVQ
jgi:hypothetical protein